MFVRELVGPELLAGLADFVAAAAAAIGFKRSGLVSLLQGAPVSTHARKSKSFNPSRLFFLLGLSERLRQMADSLR